MSRYYDNWERLVEAVLRREQDWITCHQQSVTTTSLSSISSDFGSNYSFSDLCFDFENPKDGLFLKSAQPLPFKTVAGVRNISVTRPESNEKDVKLIHFEDSPFAFSLKELLMAPSFALGEDKWTFAKTYSVSCNGGSMVVVKRFRITTDKREALQLRLKTIQSMEHENVVRLRGCFFNEDESFGFYDYFHQGSLHTMLHREKGEKGSVQLDWEGRMRIAIGAAKGLLHIHKQSGNTFVHGSVKSSNIFVNPQTEYGCLDIKPDIKISVRNRVYHAPEAYKFSQASDVYSFGVVLIELISGRSPLRNKYNASIKTFGDWARHYARDEWTTMVFDRELLKYSLAKQAMSDMLGVALCCVKKKPEERPDMKHVVDMLQLIPTSLEETISMAQ